jgi:phosphotriesterase-related protein
MTTRRQFLKQTATAGLVAAAPGQVVWMADAATSIPTASAQRTRSIVNTVQGPLDVSRLGFTLTHEHVGSGSEKIFDSRARSVANAVDKLKEARDAGIDTIVDVTTFDTGRDIRC